MIRFFFIAACFILWANSANAGCTVPCTQNQLLTEINTNWADNTTGNITPALLRAPVSDIVNTYFSLLSQYQLPVNTIAVGKGVGVNGLNSATVTAPLVLSGSTLSCPTCSTGGSGTVTSVSVVSANGFAGSVATATTTPAITLNTTVTGIAKGNGATLSAAVAGTDYQSPISLTTTGTSGAATFIGNTLNIPQYSGGGTPGGSSGQIQYNNSGAFGGFTLSGDATANTSTGALTLATVNANVGSFGSSTQCTAFTTNAKGLITAASQTTCTPAIANITGLGTGVATALAVNIGSAGSFITNGGAAGTPSSITLTNATGLVPSTGLSATGTPSSSTFLRGDNSWQTVTGTGTVTSIATTYPISGGTITTTGTLTYTGLTDSGYFYYGSATQVIFSPTNGDTIKIAGVVYQIPAVSITAANTSVFVNGVAGQNLAASTLYYVYLFNNGGTLTIDFSTTAPAIGTIAGNVGTQIKNGDNTRSLIGMVFTNGSSQFVLENTISWYNQKLRQVAATATATTGTVASVEFVTWSDEAIMFGLNAEASNGTATGLLSVRLSLDGVGTGASFRNDAVTTSSVSSVSLTGTKLLSAGHHTIGQIITTSGTPSAANEETYVLYRG